MSCVDCSAACCRYMALEIDKPACKRDYDHIRWFLLHADVHVYIDHEGSWLVEFKTDCLELGKSNLCGNYNDRPRICRYHGQEEDCEFLADDDPHVEIFRSVKEFEAYLDKRGVDWRWKRPA